ncbi:MAG TPA: TetR family transcriptional regulator [Pseudonocardia sp.]
MSLRRTNADRSSSTRAHVIAASRSLFAAVGCADTSMAQIAAAAGVSTGALYHHWATKNELLAAVVSDLHREIAAEIRTATGARRSPLQRFEAAAAVFLRRCADRDVGRILLVEGPGILGDRWDELDRRWWLTPTEDLLNEAVAAGELTTENPRLLAMALLGSLTALGRHVARSSASDEHEVAFRALRDVIKGL